MRLYVTSVFYALLYGNCRLRRAEHRPRTVYLPVCRIRTYISRPFARKRQHAVIFQQHERLRRHLPVCGAEREFLLLRFIRVLIWILEQSKIIFELQDAQHCLVD